MRHGSEGPIRTANRSKRPVARGVDAARLAGVSIGVAVGFWKAPAFAEGLIERPGDHVQYRFEAEPHLAVAVSRDQGIGPGFRGTVELVDNGFVTSINNTVGVGFGADILFDDAVLFPIVMQWNFWVLPEISVFGEPGIDFTTGDRRDRIEPVLAVGARFHFTPRTTFTVRLGTPVVTFGFSFLL